MNGHAEVLEVERQRRGPLRRRSNRRVAVQRRAPIVVVADTLGLVARKTVPVVRTMGRILAVLGLVAGVVVGGRVAVGHVLASPRFAVHDIVVTGGPQVGREEVLELAQVNPGDRLLAIDTDAVAARIALHPWVEGARVRRQLPSTLAIELTLRRAAAVVAMGGLYLIDDQGRPFKRATMAEADGLPVITGVDRERYVELREAGEAAFREALKVLETYRSRPERPALSEISIDPRFGFSLFLLDGGAEIRLGRGDYPKKLAQLDQILEAVHEGAVTGVGPLRVVHLDSASGGRVPVRFAEIPIPTEQATAR